MPEPGPEEALACGKKRLWEDSGVCAAEHDEPQRDSWSEAAVVPSPSGPALPPKKKYRQAPDCRKFTALGPQQAYLGGSELGRQ